VFLARTDRIDPTGLRTDRTDPTGLASGEFMDLGAEPAVGTGELATGTVSEQ